ncbi:hypothetical protein [Fibrobacter sp. UWB12]|uniref:hypothetical protein n=1 Tax=Fibrobacter sp. UWB12 TaxID=1896203 RepID=UPI000920547A|nr:hypothetical protein [Fibrobacter sp. UWB12]SHK84096.1 hypothetical protein SAMN05720759_107111 [Fibrobacter sp. UWB12]
MKCLLNKVGFLLVIVVSFFILSCAGYIGFTPKDRQLALSGKMVSETEFGGVERWYAVDKYGESSKVRFQVGYFRDWPSYGFVLFGGGSQGEKAYFYRQGLDLRWDWGDYAIIIQPDGTCLYYDFSYQSKGVKPKGIYKAYKF